MNFKNLLFIVFMIFGQSSVLVGMKPPAGRHKPAAKKQAPAKRVSQAQPNQAGQTPEGKSPKVVRGKSQRVVRVEAVTPGVNAGGQPSFAAVADAPNAEATTPTLQDATTSLAKPGSPLDFGPDLAEQGNTPQPDQARTTPTSRPGSPLTVDPTQKRTTPQSGDQKKGDQKKVAKDPKTLRYPMTTPVPQQPQQLSGVQPKGSSSSSPGVTSTPKNPVQAKVSIDLPFFIGLANSMPPYPAAQETKEVFFEKLIKNKYFKYLYNYIQGILPKYIAAKRNQLNTKKLWIDGNMPQFLLADTGEDFKPEFYVQKVVFPGDAVVYQWGDLHGGLHSLVNMLTDLCNKGVIDNKFKILQPNVRFMFLGDFVDRGMYGIETWSLLMLLEFANPGRIFQIRGNHEDIDYNLQESNSFGAEVQAKFSNPEVMLKCMREVYDVLPVAIFLNGKYLCCHGGNDLAYCSKKLLECKGSVKKDSVKYELLTNENYNIGVICSQLSEQVRRDIVASLLSHTYRHFYTSLKAVYFDATDYYRNIVEPVLGLINSFLNLVSSNTQTVDNKMADSTVEALRTRAASRRAQLNQMIGHVRDHEEKEPKKYIKQVQDVIQALRDAIPEFFNDIKTLFKIYQTQVFSQLHKKLVEQATAIVVGELQKAEAPEDVSAVFERLANIHTELAQKSGLHFDMKSLAALEASYNTCMENEAVKRFHGLCDQVNYINALEEKQALSKMLFDMLSVTKREDLAGLAKRYDVDLNKLKPFLCGDQYAVLDHFFTCHVASAPKDTGEIGFLWHDYACDKKEPAVQIEAARYRLGYDLTQEAMKVLGIQTVIRAHQHYDPMHKLICNSGGVACLWDFSNKHDMFELKPGMVCTLQVAHSSYNYNYPEFTCDCIARLTIKDGIMEKIRLSPCYGNISLEKLRASDI